MTRALDLARTRARKVHVKNAARHRRWACAIAAWSGQGLAKGNDDQENEGGPRGGAAVCLHDLTRGVETAGTNTVV